MFELHYLIDATMAPRFILRSFCERALAKSKKQKQPKKGRSTSSKGESWAVPDAECALEVRASAVHGKGVFAVENIAKGACVMAYEGEIISWEEADARHPHNPDEPNHTFYFALEGDKVIDGGVDGNDARWINHSCAPNCEAVEEDDTVTIYTVRKIKAGQELTYDYGLVLDEDITDEVQADYACCCGSKKCRGTMLALPDGDD